jgi:hypothetical protein
MQDENLEARKLTLPSGLAWQATYVLPSFPRQPFFLVNHSNTHTRSGT